MLKRIAFFLAIGGLGILLSTCKKPSLIGNELLEDDRIEIGLKDTLSIEARPQLRDSLLVYNPEVQGTTPGLNVYSIGEMNDPVFGHFTGSVSAQFRPFQFIPPETNNPTLDSIVLTLQYDTTGFYGPRDELQSVGVYRITEDIDASVRHYSSEQFTTGQKLGSVEQFNPRPDKNFVRIDTTVDPPDTFFSNPQLRINLDQALGEELLALDSITLTTGDDFIQVLKGLHITAEKETNSTMAFNMYGSATSLRVYYSEADTNKLMAFGISNFSAIIAQQSHDYSSSALGEYTSGPNPYDSIAFLQSLSGVDMKITLPELDVDQDVLINQATLTFTLGTLPGDNVGLYPPIEQLAIAREYRTGSPIYIVDVLQSIQGNLNRIFGGTLETRTIDGEEVQQYVMKISSHYQDIVDGMSSRELFITPRPKPSRPLRSILYGPNHSKYPMTFRVVYTVESQ